MKDKVNYYTDGFSGLLKGAVELDNQHHVAEMTIAGNKITLRILDFNCEVKRNYMDMLALKKVIFSSDLDYFLLFGLELNGSMHMRLGGNGRFNDYSYSVQGFLKSKSHLNENISFSRISVFGEGLKKWSGCTRRLERIIGAGLMNQLPDDDDCTEFEKNIKGLGRIGLYYSFKLGGLSGLHTVGLSVKPNFSITFENGIDLDDLIKHYVDLYMILRFLIGGSIDIDEVKVYSSSHLFRDGADFYFAEKKNSGNRSEMGFFIPYSTPFHDDSENEFPTLIWDSYFNCNNDNTREMIKKYVSYTMVNNSEEKFLGFYRVLEQMTLEKSSYVDEKKLEDFLRENKSNFKKSFPDASISDFFRAIKRANKAKNNTESCIHHFISGFSESIIMQLGLKKIPINEICTSRNRIIHQPLFQESDERVFRFMKITEGLVVLAILKNLCISIEKIERIALYNGLQHAFS